MRKLRVLRIITRLNVGGPALQVAILARGLDPDKFETLLVAGQEGESEGSMLTLGRMGAELRLARVSGLSREISPLRDLRALWQLVRIARAFQPHIVHTHLAKAGTLGRLAARAVGVPIVIHTFHGSVFQGYFSAARSRSFLLIERALARISTRIISIAPAQTAELKRLGIGADRLAEVALGLDLAPFRSPVQGELRRELGVAPGAPLIGIVGRLVPIKRVDIFLEAAAAIAQTRTDATFVVVGDGELRDRLRLLAADLRLSDRVRFLGWRADLPRVYADLDVLVLTSHNEGTPVSIIEALAVGTPVVATSVGGVPDLLGRSEYGKLVPPDDASAVATSVLALLADDDERARLSAAGPTRVFPAYNAGTLIARIEQLYLELAKERGIA